MENNGFCLGLILSPDESALFGWFESIFAIWFHHFQAKNMEKLNLALGSSDRIKITRKSEVFRFSFSYMLENSKVL